MAEEEQMTAYTYGKIEFEVSTHRIGPLTNGTIEMRLPSDTVMWSTESCHNADEAIAAMQEIVDKLQAAIDEYTVDMINSNPSPVDAVHPVFQGAIDAIKGGV
jgi:hypothetical protein